MSSKNYVLLFNLLFLTLNSLVKSMIPGGPAIYKKLFNEEQHELNKELVDNIYNINNDKILYEKVKKLLEDGANPNVRIFYGSRSKMPSLELAIDKGRDIKIIKLLLDYKANPEYGEDGPPIDTAIIRNNLDVLKLLRSCGAKIDPLHLIVAAKLGCDQIIDYLIKSGVDISYKDKNGATYKEYRLDYAVEHNQLKKMKELLDTGANPNIKPDRSVLPLRLAFMQNNFDSIKLLLDYGADPYIKFSPHDDSDKRFLIDLVDSKRQKAFIENYFAILRKKALSESLKMIPNEIINIINQY